MFPFPVLSTQYKDSTLISATTVPHSFFPIHHPPHSTMLKGKLKITELNYDEQGELSGTALGYGLDDR
jgi:hypothetical protein